MEITEQEVEHVAKLARLELSRDERTLFTRQLSDILTYIEKLNQLDTQDVQPMSHAVQLVNVFRQDAMTESLPREQALANAPAQHHGLFKVPKVLG